MPCTLSQRYWEQKVSENHNSIKKPEEMSTKRKKRNTVRSLQLRKNVSSGKQSTKGIRSKRLQKSNRGKPSGLASERNDFSGLLNKELKQLSPFSSNLYENSVDDLYEILPKLYKCLKQIPEFKDDKEWSEQPSAAELADYLFAKVKEYCPKDFEWTVLNNRYENELIIEYRKDYPHLEEFVAVPLEWLPKLKDKSYSLHQLTICLIYKLSIAFNLDLFETKWDNYITEDFETFLDNAEGETDRMHRVHDFAAYKTNGIIHKYRTEMRDLSENTSFELLADRITHFQTRTQLQRDLKRWLKKGVKLLNDPISITRFIPSIDDNGYGDGDPLTIEDGIHFSWSFYNTISEESEEWRNDVYNNIGILCPCESIIYSQTKRFEQLKIEKLKQLIDFMEVGRGVYYKHFDNQLRNYYDKRRRPSTI